ncbi:MAG TPA: transposase [Cytophagales bacterium]|nr:transposase [Cytophagales bacterium]
MALHTNIVLTLDTRRARKDGTYPLVYRLVHQRKTLPLKQTGLTLLLEQWNEDAKLVTDRYKGTANITRLNNQLAKARTTMMDIVLKLEEKGRLETMTVHEVRDQILPQSGSFQLYVSELVKGMRKAKQHGNADIYQDTARAVLKYNAVKHKVKPTEDDKPPQKDIQFKELTYAFLVGFEKDYLSRDGNKINGLGTYLRTLRAIINKAIKAGKMEKGTSPFEDYTIRKEKTRKRALPAKTLSKIITLQIDPDKALYHARNYFLCSYFIQGMPFADLAHLTPKDIRNGRVQYDRQKTGKPYDVKIYPALEAILNFYAQGKGPEEFIFPIIRRIEEEDQHKDVKWARKRYNRRLKEIATLCEIEDNLTSYVARHSFATHAMNADVPIKAIQEMLGHEDIRTTMIYLQDLGSDKLDSYQDQIYGGINTKGMEGPG